jgi:hypothetical protein
VLLTDYHIYHRASRNRPGAPWRPNVKMGAARISEPTAADRPSWASASAAEPPLDATPAVHTAVRIEASAMALLSCNHVHYQ